MILFAGSANLDFVVRASHIPAPGETVRHQGLRITVRQADERRIRELLVETEGQS